MRIQAWVLGMHSGASLHSGIPRISSDIRDTCRAPIRKATCGISVFFFIQSSYYVPRHKAQH